MPSQGVTNVANAIINKINNRISSHDNDENAHQDIREKIPSCGTFTELQTIISNAQNDDTIILDKDYKNSGNENYPKINKVIKIIGNGHVIDGNNASRIFNVDVDGITFENIVFVNGSSHALYGNKMNVFDCVFINNFEYYDGGAILADDDANIINSIFINNKVEADDWKSRGGAIWIGGNNSLIQDCLFIGNSARATGYDGVGGAIFLDENNNQTKIQDCLFIDNSAKTSGGGIYSSTQDFKTYNCIFTNSTHNVTNVDYLTESQSLDNYVQKSQTNGLLKNDGTIVQSGVGANNWATGNHTHEEYIQNQEFYFNGDDFVIISDEQTITKTLTIQWNDSDNANGLRPRYLQATINGITTYLSEENEWNVSIPVDTEDSYRWNVQSVTEYTQASYNEVDNVTTVTLAYRSPTPPTPSEPPI